METTIELGYGFQQSLNSIDDKPKPYKSKPSKQRYTQNWSAYNMAQTKEKFMFLKILHEVVEDVGIKTFGHKTGRPPFELKDMIKCCCIKVWNDFSSRRTIPEMEICHMMRYIKQNPHFNSICNYMNNEYITRFLHELVEKTATPLAEYEKRFAADSTGFSTFCKDKWVKVRLENRKHREYKKLHALCGVHTNVIVSCKVKEGSSADSPTFKELLNKIGKDFNVKEISADAAYLSRENVQAVEDLGAKPFIMPKKNTKSINKGHNPAWGRMIWMFKKNEARFRLHYHQRSNVESSFAMIKRKFSPFVRSKQPVAQQNEILCKVICHNISCLISAVFELNLDLHYLD